MKRQYYPVFILPFILIWSCAGPLRCPDGSYVIKSKCKAIVKYSGNTLELGSLKIPNLKGFEIEGVKVDQKILQVASVMAQTLDNQRVNQCQYLNQLSATCSPKRAEYILDLAQKRTQLDGLTLILQIPFTSAKKFSEALATWLGQNAVLNEIEKTKSRTPLSGSPEGDNVFDDAILIMEKTLNVKLTDPGVEDALVKFNIRDFIEK